MTSLTPISPCGMNLEQLQLIMIPGRITAKLRLILLWRTHASHLCPLLQLFIPLHSYDQFRVLRGMPCASNCILFLSLVDSCILSCLLTIQGIISLFTLALVVVMSRSTGVSNRVTTRVTHVVIYTRCSKARIFRLFNSLFLAIYSVYSLNFVS
jgi:hypothetical protein